MRLVPFILWGSQATRNKKGRAVAVDLYAVQRLEEQGNMPPATRIILFDGNSFDVVGSFKETLDTLNSAHDNM